MVSGEASKLFNSAATSSNVAANLLYEANKDEIANTFRLFGHDVSRISLEEMYQIARPWTQGDHWSLQNKLELDNIDQSELMANFSRMGLVEPVMPASHK